MAAFRAMDGRAAGSRPTSSALPTEYSPSTGTSCKTKQPRKSRKAGCRCSARPFLCRQSQKNATDFDRRVSICLCVASTNPAPSIESAEQVEMYEATNGVEGGTLNGKPVIVLT